MVMVALMMMKIVLSEEGRNSSRQLCCGDVDSSVRVIVIVVVMVTASVGGVCCPGFVVLIGVQVFLCLRWGCVPENHTANRISETSYTKPSLIVTDL